MENKFYAVKHGRKIGVYTTWEECQAQVVGFPKPIFRKFTDEQAALDFINNVNSRYQVDNTSSEFYKTSTNHAEDFVADLKERIDTYGKVLEKKIEDKNLDIETVNKEIVETIQQRISQQKISKRIHVWIAGCDENLGSIGVYFGKESPLNYSGPFHWQKPIDKTRLGLAAFIKAISIVSKCNSCNNEHTSLVVHVSTRYKVKNI
jgi:hypothetical protein